MEAFKILMPLTKAFIKTYWSQILVFLLTVFICWQLHGCSVDRIEVKHQTALSEAEKKRQDDLKAQKKASALECDAANKISEGIINENEAKMSDLQRELAAAKRMQTVRTVYIKAGTSNIPQGSTSPDAPGNVRPGEGYAVDSHTLIDHAGRSKAEIINYGSLQKYVRSLEPFISRCEGRE